MSLSTTTKQAIRKRARDRCEYCHSQEAFSPTAFSIEHIIPRSEGGDDAETNLALCCQECNNHKFVSVVAPDPLSGEVVPLYHPRRNRWGDHFVWNDDFTVLIGLTQTGRATITKLQLNRTRVINLRVVLRQSGMHPIVVGEAE